MSNLPWYAEEATKAASAAPSSDTTVLMTQLNCWNGPGDSVPGWPANYAVISMVLTSPDALSHCWRSRNAPHCTYQPRILAVSIFLVCTCISILLGLICAHA